MSRRAKGEYFSIFSKKDATGKQPTQDGKMQINAEMLEAITDVARSQQMDGQPICVDINMGFWVQTAKDSGQKYMRGSPSVFISDQMEANLERLQGALAEKQAQETLEDFDKSSLEHPPESGEEIEIPF